MIFRRLYAINSTWAKKDIITWKVHVMIFSRSIAINVTLAEKDFITWKLHFGEMLGSLIFTTRNARGTAKWMGSKEPENNMYYFWTRFRPWLSKRLKIDSATAKYTRNCRSSLGSRFAPPLFHSAGPLPQGKINVFGHGLCLRGLEQAPHALFVSGVAWHRPALDKVIEVHLCQIEEGLGEM